ncbi:hypothetical protein BDR26DRAFT_850699 [Obelidium mucronatum]|nr:hypothetical protein BDR26DRAFT_850699 [Obelidium mucronatum]
METQNAQIMDSTAGSVEMKELRTVSATAAPQSVPQTPQQQFMFASPMLVSRSSQPQLHVLPQPEYYRRMSLPAHLATSQINPLVQYSQIQTDLMNSFSPYMLQQFDDGSQPSLVGSLSMDGMNMFDSGAIYYDAASRAPTPYFEVPASLAATPLASPVIQARAAVHATPAEDSNQSTPSATPPASPEKQQRSNSISNSNNSNANDKKNRFKATEAELPILSAVFEKNPFPSAVLRKKLADRLGLEVKQIQFWFQNRRATLKINGIHVIKPKKTNTPSASFKAKPALSPLTEGNPYFFVEHNAAKEIV